jgi:hypothetical protein
VRKPTDDEIMALWRTVRPSEAQTAVMTWIDCAERGEETTRPMWELRQLVELAWAEGAKAHAGLLAPVRRSPWKCLHCGQTFRYEEDAIVHSNNCCIYTKPSWDDDPVMGPLIREEYSDPANVTEQARAGSASPGSAGSAMNGETR